MKDLVLELSDREEEGLREALIRGLHALNERFMGASDSRPLAVLARGEGELRGGLAGVTSRGMLHVDLLWVHPECRGGGLGSRLLGMAEAEAKARGCRGAWLDTFDFQARPFYERHGYTVFGELGGFANGHRRYFMGKMF